MSVTNYEKQPGYGKKIARDILNKSNRINLFKDGNLNDVAIDDIITASRNAKSKKYVKNKILNSPYAANNQYTIRKVSPEEKNIYRNVKNNERMRNIGAETRFLGPFFERFCQENNITSIGAKRVKELIRSWKEYKADNKNNNISIITDIPTGRTSEFKVIEINNNGNKKYYTIERRALMKPRTNNFGDIPQTFRRTIRLPEFEDYIIERPLYLNNVENKIWKPLTTNDKNLKEVTFKDADEFNEFEKINGTIKDYGVNFLSQEEKLKYNELKNKFKKLNGENLKEEFISIDNFIQNFEFK